MQELDFIFKRRSIRRYTSEAIAPEMIDAMLKAAMAAPSAMNLKPWHFIVVEDPEKLEVLRASSRYTKMMAPLAICVCGNLRNLKSLVSGKFWVQDCSAATQNLLLAASALGLGAVWCGVHPVKAVVERVTKALELPTNVIPLSLIFIGHPAEEKAARTQYDSRNVSYECFGSSD
jgi:nitroreductase